MEATPVAGKRVVVMGLGRFGGQIAVARWLVGQGADVLVTDMTPAERLQPSIQQLAGLPITYRLGEHLAEDFTSADLIVPSPAVPPSNPFLQAAAGAGIPIATEIELFLERNCAAKTIAITGTKGKSTTTAMLGKMLASAHKTHVGGNIGKPLINSLAGIAPSDWVLLELSSYMLHYLGQRRFRPDIALVTMVSADHLDWHGGEMGYVHAKLNLVSHMRPTDQAIVYAHNPSTPLFAGATAARFSTYDLHTRPNIQIRLAGEHNQLNAQGALAAAVAVGVGETAAREAVRDFPGLPHRLELICTRAGVHYVNDSIATIPDAAIVALRAFPPTTVLQIVGGYDKHLDMSAMTAALAADAKHVFCIGALAASLAAAIGPKAVIQADLAAAVASARRAARPGDTILLSPGCASYDQFENFEARGDAFRQLALA